jgi:hypothetical protein
MGAQANRKTYCGSAPPLPEVETHRGKGPNFNANTSNSVSLIPGLLSTCVMRSKRAELVREIDSLSSRQNFQLSKNVFARFFVLWTSISPGRHVLGALGVLTLITQPLLPTINKVMLQLDEFSKHREWRRRIKQRALREGVCIYCGKADDDMTQDHWFPKSKNGSNYEDNLMPCCRSCNSSKHARTPEEWKESMQVRFFRFEAKFWFETVL